MFHGTCKSVHTDGDFVFPKKEIERNATLQRSESPTMKNILPQEGLGVRGFADGGR